MTSGSETRQRTKLIALRLTDDEAAELEARAARAGLTVGAYLRQQALGSPGPRTRKVSPFAVDRALLLQLLSHIGKVGSNVNQLAYEANCGRFPGEARLNDALVEVSDMRAMVREALGKEPDPP